MADVHNAVTGESQNKIKRLENELKLLTEKRVLESRGKHTEYSQMEKKVSDLQETEKRMQCEIDELKSERDRRISEF